MAGKDWLKGFRRRNNNLSLCQPELTSRARAKAFNKTKVNTFFKNVEQVLNSDENISPRSVWNLDKQDSPLLLNQLKCSQKKRASK